MLLLADAASVATSSANAHRVCHFSLLSYCAKEYENTSERTINASIKQIHCMLVFARISLCVEAMGANTLKIIIAFGSCVCSMYSTLKCTSTCVRAPVCICKSGWNVRKESNNDGDDNNDVKEQMNIQKDTQVILLILTNSTTWKLN